jgi:hypothetical protein
MFWVGFINHLYCAIHYLLLATRTIIATTTMIATTTTAIVVASIAPPAPVVAEVIEGISVRGVVEGDEVVWISEEVVKVGLVDVVLDVNDVVVDVATEEAVCMIVCIAVETDVMSCVVVGVVVMLIDCVGIVVVVVVICVGLGEVVVVGVGSPLKALSRRLSTYLYFSLAADSHALINAW